MNSWKSGPSRVLGLESDPTVARVFVLECGMPAAVTPLILAIKYDSGATEGLSAPEYLSTVTFVSTVASVVTLTGLIAILQSGVVI